MKRVRATTQAVPTAEFLARVQADRFVVCDPGLSSPVEDMVLKRTTGRKKKETGKSNHARGPEFHRYRCHPLFNPTSHLFFRSDLPFHDNDKVLSCVLEGIFILSMLTLRNCPFGFLTIQLNTLLILLGSFF